MSTTGETAYSVRFDVLELLERGRDQVIKAPVYDNGALVAPSEATVSIFDASNTAIVDAAAATISGGIAQYTVSGTTQIPTTVALDRNWRVEWALTVAGVVVNARTDAALVYRQPYMVLTQEHLLDYHRDLEDMITSKETSLRRYIEASWYDLIRMLYQDGTLIERVIDSHALLDYHRAKCLERIFRDFSTSSAGEKYGDLALFYMETAKEHRGSMNFAAYDDDDDGDDDSPDSRRAAVGTIWTNSPRDWF